MPPKNKALFILDIGGHYGSWRQAIEDCLKSKGLEAHIDPPPPPASLFVGDNLLGDELLAEEAKNIPFKGLDKDNDAKVNQILMEHISYRVATEMRSNHEWDSCRSASRTWEAISRVFTKVWTLIDARVQEKYCAVEKFDRSHHKSIDEFLDYVSTASLGGYSTTSDEAWVSTVLFGIKNAYPEMFHKIHCRVMNYPVSDTKEKLLTLLTRQSRCETARADDVEETVWKLRREAFENGRLQNEISNLIRKDKVNSKAMGGVFDDFILRIDNLDDEIRSLNAKIGCLELENASLKASVTKPKTRKC